MDFGIKEFESFARAAKIAVVPLTAAALSDRNATTNVRKTLYEVSGAMALSGALSETLYPYKKEIYEYAKNESKNDFAGIIIDFGIGVVESVIVLKVIKALGSAI